MCQTTGSRPSDLLGLTNSWVRFCFDRAIVLAGRYTENKLSQRDKSGRPKHRLEQILADPPKPGEKAKGPRKITMGEMLAMGIPVEIKQPLP